MTTKRLRSVWPTALYGVGLWLVPTISYAATRPIIQQLGDVVGCNASNNADLGGLVSYYICTFSRYGTAIGVLIVMTAGAMYVLSGTNPTLATTAKNMIITTLTGIVAMYSLSLVLSILINTGVISKTASSGSVAPTPAPTPTQTQAEAP